MSGAKVTRIVVAGDPRLLRESLRLVLDCEPDFEVVGEAVAGPSLLRAVGKSRPDVLLLDITLADGDPRELLLELLDERPDLDVIVLTNHSEQRLMECLLNLGVRAYLHKNISPGMLKSTIRDVACTSRQTVMISLPSTPPLHPLPLRPPLLASRTQTAAPPARAEAEQPADAAEPPAGAEVAGPAQAAGAVLSDRELEVITFVAKALTNRQIASRMDITEGTVKRHLRNVFHKLRASSRIDAVNKALDARLLPPPWD